MGNSLWNKIKGKYNLHNSDKCTKKIVTMTLLISLLGASGYKKYEINTRGLNVVYGEKNIGVVRDKQEVMSIVEDLEQNLSEKLEKKIKIDKEISFVETHVKDNKLTEKDEIKAAIKEDLSYCAIGYAIKVDEKEVAYLETEEQAREALDEYKDSFIEEIDEETSEVKSVDVLEDVSLVKKEIPVSQINDIETTLSKIKTGNIEEKKHVIEDEENFWTLAQDYGVTMEDIEKVNPEKDTKKLKPGDEVIVPVSKPFLTVATYEEKKIEEEIDFEIEYEIDENLYADKEEIKVAGEKGMVELEVQVERHNGIEVDKKVLKESVIKEPVTQVIVKGTKPIPLRAATGSFITPTRGTVTSQFGARWGRHHSGLDIGARVGEPIKASDGGTVSYAQFNSGGYGYMVEIDHGNGYVTRYAHCSKLYVKDGEKVSKGDVIAAVGNSGRSTGPHLHFEVRKNGEPQNPQEYLD